MRKIQTVGENGHTYKQSNKERLCVDFSVDHCCLLKIVYPVENRIFFSVVVFLHVIFFFRLLKYHKNYISNSVENLFLSLTMCSWLSQLVDQKMNATLCVFLLYIQIQ